MIALITALFNRILKTFSKVRFRQQIQKHVSASELSKISESEVPEMNDGYLDTHDMAEWA